MSLLFSCRFLGQITLIINCPRITTWEGGAGKGDSSKQAWNISFPWSIHCDWQTDHFDLKNVYRHLAWKEFTYKNVKQQQHQNMSIITNDYIFCLVAAISLFFFREFFSVSNWRNRKNINKNRVLPEISPIILRPQFLVTEGDTLKVTLSKLSKLPVSNYFLIYVEVQFYSWF